METKMVRFRILIATVPGTIVQTEAQEGESPRERSWRRYRSRSGWDGRKETVDTFKAGNADTAVTGTAVTMMATMDVLQRASAKGLNFVITHEPTLYAHLDTSEGMPVCEQLQLSAQNMTVDEVTCVRYQRRISLNRCL